MTQVPTAHNVRTTHLEIEFLHWGARASTPVILLHGWPDAPRTWLQIAPTLAASGWSVYAPSLRGFGGTRFLTAEAPRSGQLSALGQDLIDFADALGLHRFAVVGHDWGARAAYIAACTQPQRVLACVALSVGWGTNSSSQTLSFRQVQNYWYHWYMSTPRGADLVLNDRVAFTRHIWDEWCPFWKIDPQEFESTALAFANPDWADVVLHSYRHRWGWADGDPRYHAIDVLLQRDTRISAPTLVLHGADDPCNAPASSQGKEEFFIGPYKRLLIERCGHFPQREHPGAVARETLAFIAEHKP